MIVSHRGYVFFQNETNYWIIQDGETQRVCLRVPCTKQMTEDEARTIIDEYIKEERV